MLRYFLITSASIVLGTLCLLSLSNLLIARADPDLWGHAKFGIDQIQGGRRFPEDPYSYAAADRPWINHEWLSEVIFGECFIWQNEEGLYLLRALLVFSTLFGMAYLCFSRWPSPVFVLVEMTLVWPMIPGLAYLRPHNFTYLLTVAFLIILEEYRKGNRRLIFLMPPLTALWSNLHGGFVVGTAVATVGLLSLDMGFEGSPARPNRRERRELRLALFLTNAAALLNPYGLRLYSFLFGSLLLDRHRILEWRHPSGILLCVDMILTLSSVLLLPLARAWRRTTQTIFFFVTAIESFCHLRFIYFLFLFSSLISADSGRILWRRFGNRLGRTSSKESRLARLARLLAAALASMLLCILFADLKEITPRVHVPVKEAGESTQLSPFVFPVNAVAFLKQHLLGPRLALPFHWGEYCIWHLFPRYQVSIDGRYETVYDPRYVDSVLDATRKGDLEKFLQGKAPDAILIESNGPVDARLSGNPRWFRIYRDATATIYFPRGRFPMDQTQRMLEDAERTAKEKIPSFFP